MKPLLIEKLFLNQNQAQFIFIQHKGKFVPSYCDMRKKTFSLLCVL